MSLIKLHARNPKITHESAEMHIAVDAIAFVTEDPQTNGTIVQLKSGSALSVTQKYADVVHEMIAIKREDQ